MFWADVCFCPTALGCFCRGHVREKQSVPDSLAALQNCCRRTVSFRPPPASVVHLPTDPPLPWTRLHLAFYLLPAVVLLLQVRLSLPRDSFHEALVLFLISKGETEVKEHGGSVEGRVPNVDW